MKINKKGFTLIELLVSIVIMGLLFSIATPQVSNIINKNEKKKYEAYKDSVEYAAKMYTDSYANDMFGEQKSGCYKLYYSDLAKHNLLQQFQESDSKCGTTSLMVQVNKTVAGYEYYSRVMCYKNNRLKYKHDNLLSVCENSQDDTPPEIEIETDDADDDTWKNTINDPFVININISDDSGLRSGQSIIYGFKKSGGSVSEWFNYNYGDVDPENNDEVSYEIPAAHIPKQSGKYKLIVKPDDRHQYGNGVVDVNENELHKSEEESPFQVDVDPPNDPKTTVVVDDNYAPDWDEDEEYVTEFNNGYQTKEEIVWGDLDATDDQSDVNFVERKTSDNNVSCNSITSPPAVYLGDDFDGFDYKHTRIGTNTFCIRSIDMAGNPGNWKKYVFTRIPTPTETQTPTHTSTATVVPGKCKKGKKTYKPGDKINKVYTQKNWSKCKVDDDSSKCNTKKGKKTRKYKTWTCQKNGWNYSTEKTHKKNCTAKKAANKCYKIISKKYYVCPSDQEEAENCKPKEKSWDRFIVKVTPGKGKNKNTHVHIKVKVHSNTTNPTEAGGANEEKSLRKICLVQVGDEKVTKCSSEHTLGKFRIAANSHWIGKGKTITKFNDDVKVTGLKKGETYRICLTGESKEFRFTKHCKSEDEAGHKIQAFTVTKKP